MAPQTRDPVSKASEPISRKSPPVASTPSTPTPSDQPTTTSDPNSAIYFWRHHESSTGYLCQWYHQPFHDRSGSGVVFPTAEHYMMHRKALLFGDTQTASKILEATDPKTVKALGRAVSNFDDEVWKKERVGIVREGNWCKFTLPVVEDKDGEKKERVWTLGNGEGVEKMIAPNFRDVLLATGDRELVEASPTDRIWGVGFGAKNAPHSRDRWGLNLLGKCLMEVREEFRKEKEAEEVGMSEGKEGEEEKEKEAVANA
ncbi:hypothetical protein F5Y16DRAFT_78935 [Xylariaceae sp. FL0255]|nr:hypothetical protein F5Y16DRAFT_78935 [Xylariaceae sp. FL0255]